MEEAELVLRRGMVVSITGDRPAVAARDVEDVLYSSLDLHPGDFTVHAYHPEDFLLILTTRELMDRLAGDHFISGPGFSLALRPWSKLARADVGSSSTPCSWSFAASRHRPGTCPRPSTFWAAAAG